MADCCKAKVFDLGAQGDGLIRLDGKNVFISSVCKDEEIEYELVSENRAKLINVLKASKDRIPEVCPFAKVCGGCALQHLSKEAYKAHKLRYFKQSFPEFMPLPEMDEPCFIEAKSRRRVSLAIAWNGFSKWLGLNPKQSDKILEIDSCFILVPELEKLIVPLRELIKGKTFPIQKKKGVGDVSLTLTNSGVDILFTLPFNCSDEFRNSLFEFANKYSIARISWRLSEKSYIDPILQNIVPSLNINDFVLKPPAGVFLQPSAEGEKSLQETVIEYVGKSKKILDLFCGAGTFSLALLQKKRVIKGADNASLALESLKKASEGRIETFDRDLFKTPMFPDEMECYDCVIFDPPRAGAKAQAEQIAVSQVKTVVAVSCNPETFARDANILISGGYEMVNLKPVDQFVWSNHIELVAKFIKR